MARILVACEESQATTKAFRALGHEAFSCDLLPCSGGHPERQTLRSKTFQGMAEAFASQWGNFINNK